MRKLIMLCAILMLSAFVVSAQTTKDTPKAAGPQKVMTQQQSTQKAGTIKPVVVSKPVVATQKAATIKPLNGTSTDAKVMKTYGAHAPEFNDPNYHQKLSEWIRNYPDEVKAYENSKSTK